MDNSCDRYQSASLDAGENALVWTSVWPGETIPMSKSLSEDASACGDEKPLPNVLGRFTNDISRNPNARPSVKLPHMPTIGHLKYVDDLVAISFLSGHIRFQWSRFIAVGGRSQLNVRNP
jgi:hypothetical protein